MKQCSLAGRLLLLLLLAFALFLGPVNAGNILTSVKQRILAELSLSPAQTTRLAACKETRRERLDQLQEKIAALRLGIRLELQQATVDEARVRQLHQELKIQVGAAMDTHLDALLEIRHTLSDDQHATMVRLMTVASPTAPGPEPAPIGSASH